MKRLDGGTEESRQEMERIRQKLVQLEKEMETYGTGKNGAKKDDGI